MHKKKMEGNGTAEAMRERHRNLEIAISCAEAAYDHQVAVYKRAIFSLFVGDLDETTVALVGKDIEGRIARIETQKVVNRRYIEDARKDINADLDYCTVEMHLIGSGFDCMYTASAEHARAVERTLRALAADFDRQFRQKTLRLSDLPEPLRLHMLAKMGDREAPGILAMHALLQHGPDAFEVHKHCLRRCAGGTCCAWSAYSVGRPGVAAAVHAALVEKARACPGLVVESSRDYPMLNRDRPVANYFSVMWHAARRLEQQMTPDAIAQEMMEAYRQKMIE